MLARVAPMGSVGRIKLLADPSRNEIRPGCRLALKSVGVKVVNSIIMVEQIDISPIEILFIYLLCQLFRPTPIKSSQPFAAQMLANTVSFNTNVQCLRAPTALIIFSLALYKILSISISSKVTEIRAKIATLTATVYEFIFIHGCGSAKLHRFEIKN